MSEAAPTPEVVPDMPIRNVVFERIVVGAKIGSFFRPALGGVSD